MREQLSSKSRDAQQFRSRASTVLCASLMAGSLGDGTK
jgi:hypothetical protein